MNELTNMKAAASQYPRILSPKHGQTADVEPLRANRSLAFAVSQTLSKVSILNFW